MIFKKLKDFITPILNDLINKAFYEGVKNPRSQKIPKVLQIFKLGSKTLLRNYGPFSLKSNLNEIIELVFYNCLYSFYS